MTRDPARFRTALPRRLWASKGMLLLGVGVLLGVLGLAAGHFHPAGEVASSHHCALCQVHGLALDWPPQPPSVPAPPWGRALFVLDPEPLPRGDVPPAHRLARGPPSRS